MKQNQDELKSQQFPIPTNLKTFLVNVHNEILGEKDATTTPSDDLLQNNHAFGGLVEKGGSEYHFTYYLDDAHEKTWELLLSKEELYNISSEKIQNISLRKCKSNDCKNMLYTTELLCSQCI